MCIEFYTKRKTCKNPQKTMSYKFQGDLTLKRFKMCLLHRKQKIAT